MAEHDAVFAQLPTMEQIEAERQRIQYRKAYKKALWGTVSVLATVAAAAVLIASLLMPVMQVSGESMTPTFGDGNIVVLAKTRGYAINDLCCFTWNNKTLIKRVIAGPGDWVDINDGGTVYVNGKALDEPYIKNTSLGECDLDFPYQVPEDSFFMMGDHRETSIDSRSSMIGGVHKDQIIGRIVLRVFPFDKIGFIS